MSFKSPLNGESYSPSPLHYQRRSPAPLKKPSYSQFPLPPGAPPWRESPVQRPARRPRTMEDRSGGQQKGRVSPYTLSVAAEFSLKRANRQLVAMGEALESAKTVLSPTGTTVPAPFRT